MLTHICKSIINRVVYVLTFGLYKQHPLKLKSAYKHIQNTKWRWGRRPAGAGGARFVYLGVLRYLFILQLSGACLYNK